MRKTTLSLIIISLLILSGCAGNKSHDTNPDSPQPLSTEFFAMDTYMKISVYDTDTNDILEDAENEIYRLDKLWSVTSENSEISQLNAKGSISVSEDTLNVIKSALQVSSNTHHSFDITIYPIVRAWGFTTGEHRVPDERELAALIDTVNSDLIDINGTTVTLMDGMALDLGAVAKGYTSQKVATLFMARGIKSAVLSLGGNVQTLGAKPDGSPWNIAIQDPLNTEGYVGAVKVVDKAVITSGVYQRFFVEDGVEYHHLIDPSSGKPANNDLLSVTIIADEGTLADALSTAAFIMGRDAAEEFWRTNGIYDFEMILVTRDSEICITDGLRDTFSPIDTKSSLFVIER